LGFDNDPWQTFLAGMPLGGAEIVMRTPAAREKRAAPLLLRQK